jgi:hypothetical protein
MKLFTKGENSILVDDDAEATGEYEGYTDRGAQVYTSRVIEPIERKNKETRNSLLSETDWWAVSDRTMTAEQTAYRQALRDITAHANWPNLADSDWPTKPE